MERDTEYLERCLALAAEALAAGDDPFGSVLVGADGGILHEARNRAVTGDPTQHPEFALARWAARNLTAGERRASTVYTSGEHCPMCSAAHAWAGMGRIVYASSMAQLAAWHEEFGAPASPVAMLGIDRIAPGVPVTGPVAEFAGRIKALHAARHGVAT